ncbi:MAG: OmpA family protein [Myxococcota bacterium]
MSRSLHVFRAFLLPPLVLSALIGCGMSKEEHQKAMDEQKDAMNAEMKKMREASEKEASEKGTRISALETEVKRLGGNLSEVAAREATLKSELGQTSAELASTQKDLQATSEELERLRKQREQTAKMAQAFRDLALKLKSMVDSGKLSVIVRKGRMTLNLPDDILFPSGSASLKKEGKEAIASLAGVLKDVGERSFLVSGHTDNVPVGKAGAFKSNWDLSTARAVTVTKLLIDNGVAPQKLAAAGFADVDPVQPNETPEGRAKNRRTEIILMPNIEELPVVPEGL